MIWPHDYASDTEIKTLIHVACGACRLEKKVWAARSFEEGLALMDADGGGTVITHWRNQLCRSVAEKLKDCPK